MADDYATKPRIELEGQPLAAELELKLERAVVDDHALLPDMFVLRFRDPDRDFLGRAGFEIGARVNVFAAPLGNEANELLIAGEVTALEAEFDTTGSHAVVRGYDPSHRLHRGRRTETYRNVTDADVVRTVARRVGLELGRVDETTAVHRHVSQANLSDWDFLVTRAREIGREIAVVDGKLEFRSPADADAAPQSGDLTSEDALQLVLGSGLDSFRPRVTSAEQVKEVSVRGWDPDQKEAVVGTASATTVSASLASKPADLAARFGDPTYVVVDRPYASQSEVDGAAKAVAEQIASSFAEAEGVARGNPKLRAGTSISVGLTGAAFDGLYTITSSRHGFDAEGYKTQFVVSGRQVRSLLGLARPGGADPGLSENSAIRGVVTAQVTSVADSQNQGRVKLAFPWLSENYESDWVRVVQPGAGDKRGALVLPEVNDEVLVAFEHGDVRHPFVLGGLYNGKDVPGLDGAVDGSTGEVSRRGFVSRKAHSIAFVDADDGEGIRLVTGDDRLRISLDKSKTTIEIDSDGKVSIEARDEVSIRGRQLTLEADAGVSIDGGSGNVTVKGRQIQLN